MSTQLHQSKARASNVSCLSGFFMNQKLLSPDVRIREASLQLLEQFIGTDSSMMTPEFFAILWDDVLRRSIARTAVPSDMRESGTEACLEYPDTEGWESLETSLKGISICLSYCSELYSHSVDTEVLIRLSQHANRFAREQVQFILHELVRNCTDQLDSRIIEMIAVGLGDNWSQVRYAAGATTRCLVRHSISRNDTAPLQKKIIPLLLLNRHFVAEGIKRQSQETWRILVGPAGGLGLVLLCMDNILEHILAAIESNNHSARESASACMYEIIVRVLVDGKNHFVLEENIYLILRMITAILEDDAWPVRQFGQQAVCTLFEKCPIFLSDNMRKFVSSHGEYIAGLLLTDVCNPILPIRVSATEALAAVGSIIWETSSVSGERTVRYLEENLDKCCKEVHSPSQFEDNVRRICGDQCFENRPMYSCSSLVTNAAISKMHKHSTSDDCCGTGSVELSAASQPWEISDGCIRLYAQLVKRSQLLGGLTQQLHSRCMRKLLQVLATQGFSKDHEIHKLIMSNLVPILRTCVPGGQCALDCQSLLHDFMGFFEKSLHSSHGGPTILELTSVIHSLSLSSR